MQTKSWFQQCVLNYLYTVNTDLNRSRIWWTLWEGAVEGLHKLSLSATKDRTEQRKVIETYMIWYMQQWEKPILLYLFAKNERGYRLNAIKKRFWSLLILLLSGASIRRKLLKMSHTEERSTHTNWENCNIRLRP